MEIDNDREVRVVCLLMQRNLGDKPSFVSKSLPSYYDCFQWRLIVEQTAYGYYFALGLLAETDSDCWPTAGCWSLLSVVGSSRC